jgi:hypothetical protein
MVEKYMNDTISKARLEWVERYSSMKIIPARIQAEVIKRDSLRRKAELERIQKDIQKQTKPKVNTLQTKHAPAKNNRPDTPALPAHRDVAMVLPVLQRGNIQFPNQVQTGKS